MTTEENHDIKNLKLEIENLRKQSDEYLNGWKRAKADYLNLKKEMETQNKEIKEWMSKIMILPLLGIADSFEKAFREMPDNLKNNLWIQGIENIKKQIEDYFKSHGVKPITAIKNEKFDPTKHEAVESIEGGESGMISEELQGGYMINGEVLRPVKVKVYK